MWKFSPLLTIQVQNSHRLQEHILVISATPFFLILYVIGPVTVWATIISGLDNSNSPLTVSLSLVLSHAKCCQCSFKNTNLMSLPSLKLSIKVCGITFKSLKETHKALHDLAATDITRVISCLENLYSSELLPTLYQVLVQYHLPGSLP